MSEGFSDGDFVTTLETLDRLCAELRNRTAGAELGPLAGRVLEAAGDLTRRAGRSRLEGEGGRIDDALAVLTPNAVESWMSTLNLDEISQRIARAADEAVEAALPDSAEEGETWAAWAMQGLAARDRLESAAVALERLSRMHDWAKRLFERLSAELAARDRGLKTKARWLVALNARRRAERDRLDEAWRARAWWYSARADCDELIAVLSRERPASAHVQGCPECRRDLEVAREVDYRRVRHLTGEDLWRLDLGLATSAERVAAKTHAQKCHECARALRALDEGEVAIADATGRSAESALGPIVAARRRPREGEVVRHAAFCVFVQRRRQRVQLVVQPKAAERIAAVLKMPGAPRAVQPAQTDEGLVFELGREVDVEGVTAHLCVTLSGGAEVEYDVDL